MKIKLIKTSGPGFAAALKKIVERGKGYRTGEHSESLPEDAI